MITPIRRSATALGMAALLLGSGCARHVTQAPERVARLNATAWTIRQRPAYEGSPPPSDASEAPAVVTSPAPVTPLPFRQRPEVQQALRSKPDSAGIPRDLYVVDPLLSAYRRDMDAQASARSKVGTGVLILGLIFGGFAGWSFSYAAENSDSYNPAVRSAAAQASFSGTIMGIFAVGEIIAGLTLIGTSSRDAPLRSYYRETYTDPR